ncbi:MAG: acyltransferase [Planctomycetaceae bacterium]|nr:acyltransferase [Planctomycetaceae bacterium]
MDAYQAYRSRKHFGSLDGLRALSILAVVWHHTAGTSAASPLAQHGFLGVDLFFVLSGFLIVTLLLREREAHGEISLRQFYARRALRIFPLYYGLLAASAVGLGLFGGGGAGREAFFEKLPLYLTYTSNWVPDATLLAVTWSLATEEQFYLVWPPLEKWLRPGRLLPLLAGFVVVNQLMNFRVAEAYWPVAWQHAWAHLEILQITFTPICLGVFLAHLLHHPRGFHTAAKLCGRGFAALAAVGLLLFAASRSGDISGWPRLAVHLALTCLLASCVVREDHLWSRLLHLRPLVRLGMVSYGVYLLHPLVIHLLQSLGRRAGIASPALLFVACVVVAYVAAELSFRYYESPFLRLKSRLSGGSRKPERVLASQHVAAGR